MSDNARWTRLLIFVLGVALLTLAAPPEALAASAVQGTVTTASGAPQASVWVVFEQGGEVRGKSLTGDDGKYYVGGLEPGGYRVTVRKGDKTLFSGTARVPEDRTFDIRLG
jgi:hypothetical protein